MVDVIQTDGGEVKKKCNSLLASFRHGRAKEKKKLNHFPLPHQRTCPFLWSNCERCLNQNNLCVFALVLLHTFIDER